MREKVLEKTKIILKNMTEDHISESAAQCAYYVILSFIPFLILVCVDVSDILSADTATLKYKLLFEPPKYTPYWEAAPPLLLIGIIYLFDFI